MELSFCKAEPVDGERSVLGHIEEAGTDRLGNSWRRPFVNTTMPTCSPGSIETLVGVIEPEPTVIVLCDIPAQAVELCPSSRGCRRPQVSVRDMRGREGVRVDDRLAPVRTIAELQADPRPIVRDQN